VRLVFLCAALLLAPQLFGLPRVALQRVPDGGLQPQVVTDHSGIVHLVYYTGDASAGDLWYIHSTAGGFTQPVRVNSVAGAAVATGNIRGPRMAIGRNGRVYVAWNGSDKTGPAMRAPMLFTRLNDAGTAFEPERNLIHQAWVIDGGGGIAADRDGRVYVFWHAPLPGTEGEENRRVWMARSDDDGLTFAAERVVGGNAVGACGCCSLNAATDAQGDVYVLFRGAHGGVHRDMNLLVSRDHGETFSASDISKWDVGYCVMSSEAFAQARTGVIAAWETEKQIHFAPVTPASGVAGDWTPAPDNTANRKYPTLAVNPAGEILLAWTEGMGWKKGGSLHWQLFRSNGAPDGPQGQAPGVPAWSLVAAYARPDGGFTIVY